MKNFRVVPLSLGKANDLVKTLHRHHGPMAFHIVSIGAERQDTHHIIGAATLMRPCSPVMDDQVTIEVARLVTDGTRNAASFLLGASARLAWAMGFLRIQTYSLAEESGASLRAAGWRMERCMSAQSWNRQNRPRADKNVFGPRVRWAAFAPKVHASVDEGGLDAAFFLGEAAGRAGAAITSNPFCAAEENERWKMWREAWECAQFEDRH